MVLFQPLNYPYFCLPQNYPWSSEGVREEDWYRSRLSYPSELAWGRIISLLLMPSTSAEVREYITLLLFCLHFPLFLAKAAAHHNGRYVYCIRDSQQPVCLHTQLLRRFIFMCASVSHTQFHLRLSFYLAESMGKDSCHSSLRNKASFFPALPWINGSNQIEAC